MSNRARILKDLLWVFAFCGLVAAVFRLQYGLGATTNLTDGVPWGLWKILNMVAGVALSTSGFTVGFLVYVLRRERFRPLLKTAILVAFLGYGSSCLALLFDIGLPHRFWHPFLMWNEHSFLFEVFWCVILYFTVTAIEMAAPVLERYGRERIVTFLHRIAFGVVVVGISLSSLHHSSLGSLFLVTPVRLHGLWYTSWLPGLFITSAMGAGLMFLVLVRVLHMRIQLPETADPEACSSLPTPDGEVCAPPDGMSRVAGSGEMPLLADLARIGTAVLGLHLVLRIVDLFRTGAWPLLAAGTWESWLYALELLLLAVVPVVLIAWPRARRAPLGVPMAALSATVGLLLNRLNVGIFGYWRDAGQVYVPSLIEVAVSVGVVAAAALAYLAFVENFTIVDSAWSRLRGAFRPSFDTFTHVWNTALRDSLHRVSLIGVLVLPLAWWAMSPTFREPADVAAVEPPAGLDAARATLRIDGDRGGVSTDFPHLAHQQRLGGETSCGNCHHLALPGDNSTPCSRCHRGMIRPTDIFDHGGHMRAVARKENLGGLRPGNHSCAFCHADRQVRGPAGAKACLECHREDMKVVTADAAEPLDLSRADGYQAAMHGTCLECHRREATAPDKARLAECGTCHASLRPRGFEQFARAGAAGPDGG